MPVTKFRLAYARVRRAASEPDEVRGRIGRAAQITKRDGGFAPLAFPKNKKRNRKKEIAKKSYGNKNKKDVHCMASYRSDPETA